ncbi:Hypothetical protein, putative [Bodo saltans]|uniref:Uncharacterized protein n=1 Tax=Bodo saltans TaxID=75058 RepID=A0A0S4JQA5_BODSA|nr:Hypothetical protein, putative [Bodo saltans]|eukprot:CUG90690.1 Hypothetical protein, putative [Bodo saltans]
MSEDNHAALKIEPPSGDSVCGTNEVSVSYDVAQQRLLSNEAAAAHERCSEDDETFRHLEASDIVDSDALLGSPETNAELVARVQNAVRHWKPISSTESLVSLGSVVGGGGGASLLPQNNGVASTTAATSPPPLVAGCSQPLPLTTASSGSSAVFGQLTEETLGGMSYEDLLNWSNEHAHQLDDEACSIVKRRRYPRRADGTLILSAIPLSARLGDSRFQQRAALLRRGCQDGSGEVGCGVMSPSFAGNKRQRCYSTMLVGSRFTVPTSNLLATPRAASAESATALRGHSGVDFNVPAVHPDTEGDGVDQTHGAQRARRQRRTTGVVIDAAALPLPPLGTSLQ